VFIETEFQVASTFDSQQVLLKAIRKILETAFVTLARQAQENAFTTFTYRTRALHVLLSEPLTVAAKAMAQITSTSMKRLFSDKTDYEPSNEKNARMDLSALCESKSSIALLYEYQPGTKFEVIRQGGKSLLMTVTVDEKV